MNNEAARDVYQSDHIGYGGKLDQIIRERKCLEIFPLSPPSGDFAQNDFEQAPFFPSVFLTIFLFVISVSEHM